VEVTLVDQDAPAGKAGLKEHDVILTINSQSIESVEQLRRVIREIPPGRSVTIGVSRNGQPLTLKAQLADRKQAFGQAFGPDGKKFRFAMPPIPPVPPLPAMPAFSEMDMPVSVVVVHSSGRSGLMVENLTPQLGEFFGAKNGTGVLVRSVEKGSRAEKAGFRAGDVITKVNGESISDTGDFTHAIRSHKDSPATVSVIRDKKEQTLTLSLPDRNHSKVIDESFEVPQVDAETRIALDKMQSELAQIHPDIEVARELKRVKPQLDKMRRKELKKEMEDLQRDLHSEQEDLQDHIKDELNRELRELQTDSRI
jgi:membrane-associated protease RseP (regulator of RpoE activity)